MFKLKNINIFFDVYELGMCCVVNCCVEIWGIFYVGGVENEVRIIKELIKDGMDGIILIFEDFVKLFDVFKLVRNVGVVIIIVDFCFFFMNV